MKLSGYIKGDDMPEVHTLKGTGIIRSTIQRWRPGKLDLRHFRKGETEYCEYIANIGIENVVVGTILSTL